MLPAAGPAQHPLRVGLKVYQQVHSIHALRQLWQLVEAAGFDHIWPYDHLVAHGNPRASIFDGWTILASIAETTHRIRFGLNVSGNLYRHPAQTAKIAVTIDHLSGGRLEMGIGAVRDGDEFAAFGLVFPPIAERIAMLDEACTVIRRLWTEPAVTFAGRFYQLAGAVAEPKPVQRPHPPIWIGGSGAHRTLRVVARQADVWNSNASTIAESARLSKLLDGYCLELGRDPQAIRRSVGIRMYQAQDPLDQARNAIASGFTELIINFGSSREDPRRDLEDAAALLPAIRNLRPTQQAS